MNSQNTIYTAMKGIAIICVVIGHCSISEVDKFVNQFHLAVFYFLAGFFFKEKYIHEILFYIKKKVKRLYIPFLLYGTLFLTLHNIFCSIGFLEKNNTYILRGGSFSNLQDFPVYKNNLIYWLPLYCLIGCSIPIILAKYSKKLKTYITK